MSHKASLWAFAQNVTPAAKKLVLIALADSADDYGYCWPSYDTIATKCTLGRSTIIQHIDALFKERYLTKTKRKRRDGFNTSNAYRLNLGDAIPTDHPLNASSPELGLPVVQNLDPGGPELGPKPSLLKKEKKALTRTDFLREINRGYETGEFLEFDHLTESEIAIQGQACLDHWSMKGEWPAGEPVYVLRSWIRYGIKSGAIRKPPKAKSASEGRKAVEPENPLQPWHDAIAPLVPPAEFRAWLRPMRHDGNRLIAPSPFHASYVQTNYGHVIGRILAGVKIAHETQTKEKELA